MTYEKVDDAEHVAAQYQTMPKIVADYLRAAILNGRLGPGTRLSQDEIAKHLRVSRMPVREALRVLKSEGLVELQPHRSAVVVSLPDEDIAEIFGIRAMLEAHAAMRAAPRFTDDTLARLREIYQQMENLLGDGDGAPSLRPEKADLWNALNREFHKTIFASCGWPRLHAMIDAQYNTMVPHYRVWDSTLDESTLSARAARFHKEHAQVLQAAEARDGERLARLIAEHVSNQAQELIASISRQRAQAEAPQTSA